MATLTALGAGHGFTAGDVDTDGEIAVVPAYQKIYIADGRTSADGGYNKIDFVDDKLVGVASGAFTQGEIVSQVSSNASGIFFESIGNNHFLYRTTTTPFNTTNLITGADSGETLTPSSVVAPPHFLAWTPTGGSFPDGGSNIGALSFGRIFLNNMFHPNQWFASRVGNPLDWDTSGSDVRRAITSQNSKMGLVGDSITAFIPYKDRFQVCGGLNEVWVMRNDPGAGGTLTNLSHSTGVFNGTSWCWDDKNNLYFLGTDGVYAISSASIIESGSPDNISKENIPKLLLDLGLNRRTDRIAMAYDKRRYGVHFTVSQNDGVWHSAWWLDLRNGGFFPDSFADDHIPASAIYFDARVAADRSLLFGSQDGYVRKPVDTAKNDDGETISSYVAYGPYSVGETPRDQVINKEISIELSEASDGVNAQVYVGKTSEEVINKVTVAAAPNVKKTLVGHGLTTSIKNRVKGGALAIRLDNLNANESFAVERIIVNARKSGRKK